MKILITGASEGIGLDTAKLLAAKNNQLTLVARSKDKLENAIASLPGTGHQMLVADLTEQAGLEALKEQINTNKYDILINNAGFCIYGRFTGIPLPEQEKMIDLNIKALTDLSYCYLSQAKKGDALVNLASTLGTTSFPSLAVYAGTKSYVIAFSESLWWEYKKKGIYVTAFCPGATYTNFHNKGDGDKDSYPKFVMQVPGRVAKELVSALEKRNKPKNVSGGMNRFMLSFQKLLSRKMVVNMMGDFGPLKGK